MIFVRYASHHSLGITTKKSQDDKSICELARDAFRTIAMSYDAISCSTPHLYISALTWLPTESALREILYPKFSSQPLILFGREERWQSALWVNATGSAVWQVEFTRLVFACRLLLRQHYIRLGGENRLAIDKADRPYRPSRHNRLFSEWQRSRF